MKTMNLNRKGFSLIEIIIVISILAVILAIGMPYFFKSKANTQLRNTARELKITLEMTRSEAKADGANVGIEFVGTDNQISGHKVKDETGRVIKSVTFPDGVTGDITGLTSTPLEFKSNGSITTDGTIVIRSSKSNKYFTLTLVKTTGLVTIDETN